MYQPKNAPSAPNDAKGLLGWAANFANWIAQELRAISAEFNATRQNVVLKVLYGVPARIYPGMLVYADGVTWNPGSGEGVYRRNALNTAWVFVG